MQHIIVNHSFLCEYDINVGHILTLMCTIYHCMWWCINLHANRQLKYYFVDPVCDWNNSKKELLLVRWPVQWLKVAKNSKEMVTFPKYYPRYSWEFPLIPKPPDYFGDISLTKAVSRKYFKQIVHQNSIYNCPSNIFPKIFSKVWQVQMALVKCISRHEWGRVMLI